MKSQIQNIDPSQIESILAKKVERNISYCLVKLKGLSTMHSVLVQQNIIPLQLLKDYYSKTLLYHNYYISELQDYFLIPLMIIGIVSHEEVQQMRQEVISFNEQSSKITDFLTDVDQRVQELKINKQQVIYEQLKQKYPDYQDKYAICLWGDTSITFEHCYQIYNFESLLINNTQKQESHIWQQIRQQGITNLLVNYESMNKFQKIKFIAMTIYQFLQQDDQKICIYNNLCENIVYELLCQQKSCLILSGYEKFEQYICQKFNIKCVFIEQQYDQQLLKDLNYTTQIIDYDEINVQINDMFKYNMILVDGTNTQLDIQKLIDVGYSDIWHIIKQYTNNSETQDQEFYSLIQPFNYIENKNIPQNIAIINHKLTFEQCLKEKLYIDSNSTIYRILNDPTKGNLIKQTINRQLKHFSAQQYNKSIQSLTGGIAGCLFIDNPNEQNKDYWQFSDNVQQMIINQLNAYLKQKIYQVLIIVPELFYQTFIRFLNTCKQQQQLKNIKILNHINDKWQQSQRSTQIKILTEQQIIQFINEQQNIELLSENILYPLFSYRITELLISNYFQKINITPKIIIHSFEHSILYYYQLYKIKFAYKINEEQQFDNMNEEISNGTTDTDNFTIDVSNNVFINLFPKNQYLDIVLSNAWADILQVDTSFIRRDNEIEIQATESQKQRLFYNAPTYYYQFDENNQQIYLSSNQYMSSSKEQQSVKENERVCMDFYYNLQQNLLLTYDKLNNYQAKYSKHAQQGKTVQYLAYNNYYSNKNNNENCLASKIVKGNTIPQQPVSICIECGAVGSQQQESFHSTCELCESNKLSQSLETSFRQLYSQKDITIFDETCTIVDDQIQQVYDFFYHDYFIKTGNEYSNQTIQFFKKISNNFEQEISALLQILQKPFFKQDISKTICAASSIVWRYSPLFYRAQKTKLYSFSDTLQTIYTDAINFINGKQTLLPKQFIDQYIQNYYDPQLEQLEYDMLKQFIQQNPYNFYEKEVYQQYLQQFWQNIYENCKVQPIKVQDILVADQALALSDFNIQVKYQLNVKDQQDQTTKFKQLRIERYQIKNISYSNSLYAQLSQDQNKNYLNKMLLLPKQKQIELLTFLLGVQYPTILMQYGNCQHLQQVQDILLTSQIFNLETVQFSLQKNIQLNYRSQKAQNNRQVQQKSQIQIPTVSTQQPRKQVKKMNFIDYIISRMTIQEQKDFIDEVVRKEKQITYFRDKDIVNIPQVHSCPISDPTDFVNTVFKCKTNKYDNSEINQLTENGLILDIFKYYKTCAKIQSQPIKVPQREEIVQLLKNEIQENDMPKNIILELVIRKFINQSVDSSYQKFIYWKDNSYDKKKILKNEDKDKIQQLFNSLKNQGIYAGLTPCIVFMSQEYKNLGIYDYKVLQCIIQDATQQQGQYLKQIINVTDKDIQDMVNTVRKMRLMTSLTNETDFTIFITKLYKLTSTYNRSLEDLTKISKQLYYQNQCQSIGFTQQQMLLQQHMQICQIEKQFIGANHVQINELVYPVTSFIILNKETCATWQISAFAKVVYLAMFGRKPQFTQQVISEQLQQLNKKSEGTNLITVQSVTDFITSVYEKIAHIYGKVCDYLQLTINKEQNQIKTFNQYLQSDNQEIKQYENKNNVMQRKIKIFSSLLLTSIEQIQNSPMFSILQQYQQQNNNNTLTCEIMLQYCKDFTQENQDRTKFCIQKLIQMMQKQQVNLDTFLPTQQINKEFIKQRNALVQQQLLTQYYSISQQMDLMQQSIQKQEQLYQQFQNNNKNSQIQQLTQQQVQQLRELPENTFLQKYEDIREKLSKILGQKILELDRIQLAQQLYQILIQGHQYGDVVNRTLSFLTTRPDYDIDTSLKNRDELIQQIAKQTNTTPQQLFVDGSFTNELQKIIEDQDIIKKNLSLFKSLFQQQIDISYHSAYYTRIKKWDQQLDNDEKAVLHQNIQNLQLFTKKLLYEFDDQKIEYMLKLHLCSYLFFQGTGKFQQ